jgi:Fungal chitosanase of glycosyl hydrolase group 75
MSARVLAIIGGVSIFWDQAASKLWFQAGVNVDSDGDPLSYAPGNRGKDWTADAGQPGDWWGVACDKDGIPYVQDGKSPAQPNVGMYISTTSYEWPEYPVNDVRRYVDAETVPFIVFPEQIRSMIGPIVLGCAAQVTKGHGTPIAAVVADFGPSTHAGEASEAMCIGLGVNPSPRTGGDSNPIYLYECFPGRPAVVLGKEYPLISE